MKNLTLSVLILAGMLISFFHSVPALAGRTVTVPAIQLQKTGNYLGQYATIYYGFEKTTIIHADSTAIALSSVRMTQTRPVSSDTVQFPSVQIDKDGFRGAYDIVVVVISHYPNFSWKNADGSFPEGVTDSKIYEISTSNFHKSSEIEAYVLNDSAAPFFPWSITTAGIAK